MKRIGSLISPYYFLVVLLSMACLSVWAQQEEVEEGNTEPAGSLRRFVPRPKFVILETEWLPGFDVSALSDIYGDARASVSQHLIRNVKVKFPLFLDDRMSIAGGLGYRHEQFKFHRAAEAHYPLFTRFDDKSLKRLSANLYLKRTIGERRFLLSYISGSLNSDRLGFDALSDQLTLSASAIYGKNVSRHKQIGWGASLGYRLALPTFFPVLMIKNNINLKWGYELLLPKTAKIRFSPSESNHIFASAEVKGACYYLRDNALEEFDAVVFRRSSVRLTLRYEREIHDWLWVSASAGYRIPVNMFVAEPGKRRRDAIVTIRPDNAFYSNFALFFVPPAKLYNKNSSR